MTWSVASYNTNPALNTTINGTDISENCSPAGYNDALRQIMADIATWTVAYAVTYPIAINLGGTGQTTAAGALSALGGLSSAYQRLPQTAETGTFIYAATMDGGHVRYTGGAGTARLTTNALAPFTVGACVLTINDGSGALTIAPDSGVTLVWGATGGTGNRALTVGGMATLINVATDRWFITGTGLT